MRYSILITAILFCCLPTTTLTSQIGFSMSYSTGKTLGFDLFYFKENNRFHIGYGYQFNGQKNKVVKEREANYGLTPIESGDFFGLVDLGYSRVLFDKLTIHPEVSFGTQHQFTSFKDDRFSDGGYSLISKSTGKTGVGCNVGFLVTEQFEVFVGYHTLKKLGVGMRLAIGGIGGYGEDV